jgi:hypothetical protein
LYTNTDGQALPFVPKSRRTKPLHPKLPAVSTAQTFSTLIVESKTGVEKTPVL